MIIFLLTLLLLTSCHGSRGAVVSPTFAAQASQVSYTVDNSANVSSTIPASEALGLTQLQQTLEQKEWFRRIPEHFKDVDFAKRSYSYNSWDGRKVNIAFKNGETTEIGSEGFSFNDVYYVDLTGDGKQEAIIELGHVVCGASCDGGAAIFYSYTQTDKGLREIWQYETGSTGYGCGLKSLTIKQHKITLELFARCSDDAQHVISGVNGKFTVEDLTRLEFTYNGSKVVKVKKTFIDTPSRDVRNYISETTIEP